MTNFNFKFLGAWLVIVASITGLQAQNDFTLKGKGRNGSGRSVERCKRGVY